MSISMTKIHDNPRFTRKLVEKKALKKSPLVIADIGARGGAGKEWKIYNDQYLTIGFEADPLECERLNKNAEKHERFYPVALGAKSGKRTFHIHEKHPPTSSFYDSDEKFLKRFPGWVPFMPTKRVTFHTTDFKTFARQNAIDDIDVLKMDVEGAELDVLRGMSAGLMDKIFCINTEAYLRPWGKGAPSFSDMDMFLRKHGFVLYDLPILRWEKKSTSPYMFTDGIFGPTERGQMNIMQPIYFRDAVAEFDHPRRGKNWTAEKILKLASVFELYQFEDCAIELLQEAVARKILPKKFLDEFIDLLTPPIDGRHITYKEYVAHIKKVGPPRYISGRRVTQEEYAEHIKQKSKLKK